MTGTQHLEPGLVDPSVLSGAAFRLTIHDPWFVTHPTIPPKAYFRFAFPIWEDKRGSQWEAAGTLWASLFVSPSETMDMRHRSTVNVTLCIVAMKR